VKISTEQQPQREACLDIELEPDEMEQYLDRAYRRIVQRASVPGFRKGKAPRSVVEQYFGRDHLVREAMDFLLPEVTAKAVTDQGLEIVGQPQLDILKVDPVRIKARVALKPQVSLDDYRAVRVEPEEIKITDDQVQQVLRQIQRDMAPWEPADRSVLLEDLINLDVSGTVDEVQIVDSKGVDYVAQAENPTPIPGFSEALVGIDPGETRDFSITLPEDYADQNLAGKTCAFTVVINEIKEKKLPDLDNEFVKSVSEELESLEELKKRIYGQLRDNAESTARQIYEQKVVDEVIDKATVTMSDLLIDYEVENMLEDQGRALQQQRLSMEDYLERVGKDPQQIKDELRPGAEVRLRKALVLEKVAEIEEVEASDEEMREEIEAVAPASRSDSANARKMFNNKQGQEFLRRMIVNRKTVSRLAEIARSEKQPMSKGNRVNKARASRKNKEGGST
jgi:trigger factor